MSNMRMILIEAAMLTSFLMTGLAVSQAAHASPLAASIQSAAADARANVKIDSKIFVEKTQQSESGKSKTTLVDPATVKVTPGDKLLFLNTYRNTGKTAVTGFVVNNPVHAAVAFVEVLEGWALVSVDGGKTYGKLSDFTVTAAPPVAVAEDGSETTEAVDSPETPEVAPAAPTSRAAIPSDVTHIRWILPSPIPAGSTGELRFRGIVK